MLTAITGVNWGDEGKGRMVDLLSRDYDIVARYQGGNNAGHTVKNERGKFILNLLPSGILRPGVVCVMGGGMVIDPAHLEKEIAALRAQGVEISPENLKISDRATVCMPWHVAEDGLEEDRLSASGSQFGSTRRGIAYAYGDKYMKKTLRMGDLVHLDEGRKRHLATIVEWKNLTMERVYGAKPIDLEEAWAWCQKYGELFRDYVCDTGAYLADADDAGKKIMFEAQLGALRDIDFGIYPYTSSSNVIGAYAPIGAGLPGHKLDKSIGIMKAYSSCVGEGPFTAELAMTEEEKHLLREAGHEYGAATGRPRRVGPFDVVASRYGANCQGADELALTLLGHRAGQRAAGGQNSARLALRHQRLPPLGGAARGRAELRALHRKGGGPAHPLHLGGPRPGRLHPERRRVKAKKNAPVGAFFFAFSSKAHTGTAACRLRALRRLRRGPQAPRGRPKAGRAAALSRSGWPGWADRGPPAARRPPPRRPSR